MAASAVLPGTWVNSIGIVISSIAGIMDALKFEPRPRANAPGSGSFNSDCLIRRGQLAPCRSCALGNEAQNDGPGEHKREGKDEIGESSGIGRAKGLGICQPLAGTVSLSVLDIGHIDLRLGR